MMALTQGGTVHEVGGVEARSLLRRLTVEEEEICGEVCNELQHAFDAANAQLSRISQDQEDVDIEIEPGIQDSSATLYDVPFLSESDLESDTEEATGGNRRLRDANPDPGATPTGGR